MKNWCKIIETYDGRQILVQKALNEKTKDHEIVVSTYVSGLAITRRLQYFVDEQDRDLAFNQNIGAERYMDIIDEAVEAAQ